MLGQFNHPCCSVIVVTGNAQILASDLISESFIQAVIARKDLRRLVLPINPMRLTARDDSYISFLSDKRAAKSADQFHCCIW